MGRGSVQQTSDADADSTKLANPLYDSEAQGADDFDAEAVLVEGASSEAEFYDTMIASDEEGEDEAVTFVHQLHDLDDDYTALFAEFDVKEAHGFLNKKETQHLIHARYPLVR